MAKKKLTDAEIAEVNDYLANELPESKKFVTGLAHKPDHMRLKQELKEFEKLQRDIEQGKVKKNKDGEEVNATVADVEHITRLNRSWTPDILKEVLLKLRCPLDLHLYADDLGVQDAD